MVGTIDGLSKAYDEVVLALGIIKRLKYLKIDSLNNRIQLQKGQYFAQIFGVSPPYEYNLYIRGPYSPHLCNDIYKLMEAKINPSETHFSSSEMESRFAALQDFLHNKTTRQLEVISTYHWLVKEVKMERKKALNKLRYLQNTNLHEEKMVLVEFERLPQ